MAAVVTQMDSPETSLGLAHRLAVWSDGIQSRAEAFVEAHRDLLLRDVTPAQLHGLQNVVGAAPDARTIRSFAAHQAAKASNSGRAGVERYWNDLRRDLDSLRRDADILLTEGTSTKPSEASLDLWHRRLMGEFVQHLVAHSLWLRFPE